jgi:hypothetical protein
MACRLAAFRLFLAVSSFVGLSRVGRMARNSAMSTLHDPLIEGLPPLNGALPVAWALAAAMLALGRFSRTAAAVLVLLSAWILASDVRYFSNNGYFHLLLLLPLVFLPPIPFPRLWRAEPELGPDSPLLEFWIRAQAAIVMVFAGVDKIFSPDWPAKLVETFDRKPTTQLFGFLEYANLGVITLHPHAVAALIISLEIFLGIGLLIRRLHAVVAWLGIGFAVYLESMVAPGMFAWDVAAVYCLLLPVGTGAHPARRKISIGFDWYRRLHHDPAARVGLLAVLIRLPVALYLLFWVVRSTLFTRLGLATSADRILILASLLAVVLLREAFRLARRRAAQPA